MYVVNVLNSEEAVMNSESIIGIFENAEDAVEFFESEKTKVCNTLGIEDPNQSDLVRENKVDYFSVYSDEYGFGSVIQMKEINDTKNFITVTHF